MSYFSGPHAGDEDENDHCLECGADYDLYGNCECEEEDEDWDEDLEDEDEE